MKDQHKRQTVFKEDAHAGNNLVISEQTSTGLQPNLAGLLTYLFGFITGIIFLLIEKENKYVRFHAMQPIIVSVFFFVLGSALTLIPIIGWIISILIAPVSFIIWVLLMIKAYQNKWYKLPFAGEMAMNQIKK